LVNYHVTSHTATKEEVNVFISLVTSKGALGLTAKPPKAYGVSRSIAPPIFDHTTLDGSRSLMPHHNAHRYT
jgi:hypothetical protein